MHELPAGKIHHARGDLLPYVQHVLLGEARVAKPAPGDKGHHVPCGCNIFNILILIKIYFFAVSSIQEFNIDKNLFLCGILDTRI